VAVVPSRNQFTRDDSRPFVIRHSAFVIVSLFGFRHSGFLIRLSDYLTIRSSSALAAILPAWPPSIALNSAQIGKWSDTSSAASTVS
jgi:hypothetical protein